MVAMEAPVFLRSVIVVDAGGDSDFLLVLFLDSHAKGPVSFLDVVGGFSGAVEAVGAAGAAGGAGGGGNLTGDILPERPWIEAVESWESRSGAFGTEPGAFAPSAVGQSQNWEACTGTRGEATSWQVLSGGVDAPGIEMQAFQSLYGVVCLKRRGNTHHHPKTHRPCPTLPTLCWVGAAF